MDRPPLHAARFAAHGTSSARRRPEFRTGLALLRARPHSPFAYGRRHRLLARIRAASNGKALQDNLEPGELIFIDPSLADDFWADKEVVKAYFLSFG